jgi:ubiquinone/menaquinone biosynthesis C-methylase UbiE/uncharacterized protein YbaR (Trm112 family)
MELHQAIKYLVDPIDKMSLIVADKKVLSEVNEKIATGECYSLQNHAVRQKVKAGLVNDRSKLLYPVYDKIPILSVAEAIPVQNGKGYNLERIIEEYKTNILSGKHYEEFDAFSKFLQNLINLKKKEEDFIREQNRRQVFSHIIPELERTNIVLDIGCGPGFYAEHLYNKGHTVFAFELSYQLACEARKRLEKASTNNKENRYFVCVADAKYLPFADNTFDLALAVLVWRLTGNVRKSISEGVRVTKPTGKILGTVSLRSLVYTTQRKLQFLALTPFIFKTITASIIGITILPLWLILNEINKFDGNRGASLKECIYASVCAVYSTLFMVNNDQITSDDLHGLMRRLSVDFTKLFDTGKFGKIRWFTIKQETE